MMRQKHSGLVVHNHVYTFLNFIIQRFVVSKIFITYDASTEESDKRISLSLRISEFGDFWLDMLIFIGDIVSLVSAKFIVISGLVGSFAFLTPRSIVPQRTV